MDFNTILYYVQKIGKILSIGISLYAVIWSLVSIVKIYLDKMQIAVENKDWAQMIDIIGEFVTAAEQKFIGEKGSGAKKKEEVIKLLQESGYEVTKVIDALIESIVYKKFNADKQKSS